MIGKRIRWSIAALCAGVLCCVLVFFQSSWAAPKGPQLPFANAAEQRADFIRELRQMNGLLREQNALLKSGRIRVIVVEEDK